jgi:hypothetical protein
MIGAGAVVTRDVPAKAIVSGQPGANCRLRGCEVGGARDGTCHDHHDRTVQATSVRGVSVHRLTLAEDLRGRLTAVNLAPKSRSHRSVISWCSTCPARKWRGEHAHRQCQQFLVCIRGSVSIVVDDGTASEEIEAPANRTL